MAERTLGTKTTSSGDAELRVLSCRETVTAFRGGAKSVCHHRHGTEVDSGAGRMAQWLRAPSALPQVGVERHRGLKKSVCLELKMFALR